MSITINTIKNVDTLRLQVQELERQVYSGAAGKLSHAEIAGLLEGAQEKLHNMRQQSASIQSVVKPSLKVNFFAESIQQDHVQTLNSLDEKIITLFGDLDTISENEDTHLIEEEREKLQSLVQAGNPQAVAQEISVISRKIGEYLTRHPRPTREHRHVIALAEKSVREANQLINPKVLGTTINQLNILEEICWQEDEEVEPQVMQLFDIAEALYFGRLSDARKDHLALSGSAKYRFEKHLEKLGGNPRFPFAEKIPAIQALLASAEEVAAGVETTHYATDQEIEQMYGEILELTRN